MDLLTEQISSGTSGSFSPFNGFQPSLFDVEMHGVIATTPVCCNTTTPPPPLLSRAQRGSQTCYKQEGPRLDLGKMGTFLCVWKRLE